MHVTVQAFDELRHLTDRLPADGRLALPPGTTVEEVLVRLGLDPILTKGLILFRNGRPAGGHVRLEPGDRLTIMAPMTGG